VLPATLPVQRKGNGGTRPEDDRHSGARNYLEQK
jgi:hypothetical protein